MVTLVMILRDEEKTIVETLKSITPHVHRVCLVDTGSQDKTLELACALLVQLGISHAIHRKPWVNYSHNRNEALMIARRMSDPDAWLWMLSADCRVEFNLPTQYPAHLRNERILFEEGYLPKWGIISAVQLTTVLGNWVYPQTCLFRADSDWRYEGVTHEVPVSLTGQTLAAPPRGVTVRYLGTGDKRARWLQDVELLQEEIRSRGAEECPREMFYLAQSYECLGAYMLAAQWYHLRSAIPGYWAERWEAQLRLALLPGVLPWTESRNILLELTRESPRAEPWFYLADLYAQEAELEEPKHRKACWELAYIHARIAYVATKFSLSSQEYMVRQDVYQWRAQLLYAVCCYGTGRNQEALPLFEGLLAKTSGLDQGDRLFVRQHTAAIREALRAEPFSQEQGADSSESTRDSKTFGGCEAQHTSARGKPGGVLH
jgi:hypothetical protein